KYSDSSCNKTGHWSKEEHHKFLEGMFLFGNDWKSVQNHIGTRSSTQARSHAQKFFQRMKKKLRWESNASKNISKEFLFNLFKDSSPNKDIGEENKAKLMKIIGSFTDPPLK
ncbi:MAG: SANT/Myb-like DNA-binding domain-containing protein, partial [Flammeovirgaceae bacterium]